MKSSNTTSSHKFLVGLCSAMLGLFMLIPAHGQIFTVTMTGTLTGLQQSATYWDSSVHVGTSYALTFTLDANESQTGSSTGFTDYYTGGSATISSISATVGDYTFSQSAIDLGVRSLSFTPSQAGDLLYFGNSAPFTQNGLTVYAGDAFGTVIGGGGGINDTSLNSVNEVSFSPTNPTNLFRLSGVFNINSGSISGNYSGQPGGSTSYDTAALEGSVTTYSVSEVATPEPSTWALLLGGLGLLAFMQKRTRLDIVKQLRAASNPNHKTTKITL